MWANVKMFTKLFNRCIADGKVASSWKNASVIILHKKGDTADIKNYRPINLLPITYKVFSQILLRRMLDSLEQHQPREQAGFRADFLLLIIFKLSTSYKRRQTSTRSHSVFPS